MQKITPCLWFDNQAEEAAKFYTSIFKDSKTTRTSYYGEAGHEQHGQKAGTVLVVEIDIKGQPITLLNGGPVFKFNEAVSLQVPCDSQEEIDYYWDKLAEGGAHSECGWLKDKYGLSWQVFPAAIMDMLSDSNRAKSQAAMAAMMKMKKMDLATLRKAYNEA
ncbi:VOC family protein [Pseudoduganella sp. RAF53_2]|uniref:VOC family protein n=1 Tax=unclassified Pseudoduganella TaxID=2637179 RepID=UPI003F951EA8